MKKPKDLLSKMLFEANNVENTAETRQNCRDCAEYLETVILSGVKPKLVPVPFSWFYEAHCGMCGSRLETDEDDCSHCGMPIDWSVLITEHIKKKGYAMDPMTEKTYLFYKGNCIK